MKTNETLPVREFKADEGAGKHKRTLRNKIISAVLCVIGAFALWLFVMQTESPTYTETVSGIEVRNENADVLADKTGLSVYSGEGTTVNVVVSGKKSLIARLSSGDVGATVDVSMISVAGRHALPVTIDLPSGLTLADTVPATVTVYADETVSKVVSVREKLTHLELPANYKQGKIEFGFDTVTVEGPASKVNGIAEAQVVIDMENKTSSFSAKYPITLTDSLGAAVSTDYLKLSATEIDVIVPVYVTAELSVPYQFKYGLFPEGSVQVTMSPSAISVSGDENDVTSDSAISPVIIDEKAITSNSYSFSVTPEISPKLSVETGTGEVTVNVEVSSSLITKEFTVEDIRFTGMSSAVKCEAADKSVTVTLRGTKEQLDAIGEGDVYLTVDMTGYDAGSTGNVVRPAAVVIEANNSGGVFEVGTYSVQVKIN